MEILLNGKSILFETIEIKISERNIENIFKENKKILSYKLQKAILNPKNRLYSIAQNQLEKHKEHLNSKFGDFLLELKLKGDSDYNLYLNKYGDKKYCVYKIEKFEKDKGIYCYIVENEIVYIGRSKKTFKQRFADYGKITAYNCLIDGQSTNCNVNSKINELEKVYAGFYLMPNNTDAVISALEKELIQSLKKIKPLWNIQQS